MPLFGFLGFVLVPPVEKTSVPTDINTNPSRHYRTIQEGKCHLTMLPSLFVGSCVGLFVGLF